MRPMLTGLALTLTACGDDRAAPAANQAGQAGEIVIAETDAPRAEGQAPAAPIPANFRGIWAEGRAACAQLSHSSRLIISESVIRYPAFVLIGEGVNRPTDSSFAINGRNQRTGAPAEAHFSIDATGSVLTDEAGGGAVRVKCR